MVTPPPAIAVPLRTDQHGIIRVADTRVTLDAIIARHLQGDTPEQIHEGFPTVKLADVYSVISYYLNNQAEVDAYLREQDELAEKTLREIEAERPDMFVMQRKLRERTQRDKGMRFLADENFNNYIVRGVLRENPAVDILRVQDTEVWQADCS